jgi:hypothetical protein
MIRALVVASLIASPAFAEDRASHAAIPKSSSHESDKSLLLRKHLELLIRDLKGNFQGANARTELARNSILSQLLQNKELMKLAMEMAKKQGVEQKLRTHASHAPSTLRFLGSEERRAHPSSERYESLRKWDLDKLAQRFQPALQNAMRKAGNGGSTEPGPFTMENIESTLRRFEGWIDKIQARLPDSVRDLSELEVRRPGVAPENPLSRTFFAPSNLSKIAQAVMIGLAAAAAGWFLVHLSFEPRRRRQARKEHFTLVEPTQVVTREDLISAFERLALVFFGPEAASWHHRLVAQRIGEKTSAVTDADFLAALYEQARYAPQGAKIDWRESQAPLRRIAQRRR